MKSIFLVCMLITLNSIPAWAKDPIRVFDGAVTRVSDGDTVQVQDALGTKVKVRLYGIDAPETEKRNRKTGRVSKPGQPYGEEAFRALRGKVAGQFVKVEVLDIDRYRRAVSVIRYGNRDITGRWCGRGSPGRTGSISTGHMLLVTSGLRKRLGGRGGGFGGRGTRWRLGSLGSS